MKSWGSVEEVLDFAIGQEEISAQLYTDLAQQMEEPALRKTLLRFAVVEQRHKEKLLALKQVGVELHPSRVEALDLKMAEYIVPGEIRPDMSYAEILTLAMQREKAAHDLYLDLAAGAAAAEIRDAFLVLAQEEASHKQYFEAEYDEQLKEN
jgi:rubrerythrin